MYTDILVPTDGSDASLDAAEHAFSHAERYGATVHVLSVVEEEENTSIVGRGEGTFGALREEGEKAVEEITDSATERGLDVRSAVKVGTPHRVIRDYADEHGVDLIVMSTHGRSGVDRFLMGSVTERVLRVSDVPVLAVKR